MDTMEKSRLSRLMYLYTEAGVGQFSQTRPQAQVQYRRRCVARAPHPSLQVGAALAGGCAVTAAPGYNQCSSCHYPSLPSECHRWAH